MYCVTIPRGSNEQTLSEMGARLDISTVPMQGPVTVQSQLCGTVTVLMQYAQQTKRTSALILAARLTPRVPPGPMDVRSAAIDPVAPSRCKCGCISAAGCRFLATGGQFAGPALHVLPRGTEARACLSSPTGPTQNGTIEKQCCASHGQSTLPVVVRSFGRLEQKTVATEDRFLNAKPSLALTCSNIH
jgi:hypothetical protein